MMATLIFDLFFYSVLGCAVFGCIALARKAFHKK